MKNECVIDLDAAAPHQEYYRVARIKKKCRRAYRIYRVVSQCGVAAILWGVLCFGLRLMYPTVGKTAPEAATEQSTETAPSSEECQVKMVVERNGVILQMDSEEFAILEDEFEPIVHSNPVMDWNAGTTNTIAPEQNIADAAMETTAHCQKSSEQKTLDAVANLVEEMKQEILKEVRQVAAQSHREHSEIKKTAEQGMAETRSVKKIVVENRELLISLELSTQILQSSLQGMWSQIQSEGKEISARLNTLHKTQDEIREDLKQIQKQTQDQLSGISEEILEDAEKFMALLFGADWRNPKRLCNESCDALVTAHALMSVAEQLNITNYAGIVITAVWALEHECRRRFRDSFDRYLQACGVQTAVERAEKMKLKYRGDGSAEYTLGSLHYVVKSQEFDGFARSTRLLSDVAEQERNRLGFREAQMFRKYWLPGTKTGADTRGVSFKSCIMDLNDRYRIPAAHAEEVSRQMAVECYNLLGITTAHQKVNHVEGALKSLLWLTAPLEESEDQTS